MKIVYLKLVNFADVYAAMGKTEIEFHFDHITKPIIQIYGRNRCGKTVLLQKLHPFSSINLNGDERNDVPLIIKGEIGIKEIVYEIDGEVYNIKHVYKPTTNGHTVTSSMMYHEKELNTGGGVNTFNAIVDKVFGINRYVFQFIINGTQLTSFANMNSTQRKNLMNKAMGIDIYDKIHKLSTDDYRYTNKLITSLSRTKEFLLQHYGSYETLRKTLEQTESQYSELTKQLEQIKTRIDQLTGIIASLRDQNISMELTNLQQKLTMYQAVVNEFGQYDPDMYEHLMEEQMQLNHDMSEVNTHRSLLLKDLDIAYEKKAKIEQDRLNNQRVISDYQNMLKLKSQLENQIMGIVVEREIETPSSAFMSMLSIASAVNDTCKEITISLNQQHLELFCDMILKGVDISAFLIQEGSVLMDSEKEKSTISRIRHMLNTVPGDAVPIENCRYDNCLYRNTFERLSQYFHSYESVNNDHFTQYDLEQFEHALKNYQTMRRLLNIETPIELKTEFDYTTIINRIKMGLIGIDVDVIKKLMEDATKIEMRKKYITQLCDTENTIHNMENLLDTNQTSNDDMIGILENDIMRIRNEITTCEQQLVQYRTMIEQLDHKKSSISSIKNFNIQEIQTRYQKLQRQQSQLTAAETEYTQLHSQFINIQSQVQVVQHQLDELKNADRQYTSTVDEIERQLEMDQRFKIIAEATSSTKGKPVIAIRETIGEALSMANRLLDVMYDGEIELLRPVINETTFALPFRCGTNHSDDIRTGSQSESTLLSLALSLSLAYCLTGKFVPLVDEIDAYIDTGMRDVFVLMLQEIMSTLKLEQMFLISHSIQPNQYEHIVHTIDITK
jgi:DNA repair exonuclease SbcCD ATPase subunit